SLVMGQAAAVEWSASGAVNSRTEFISNPNLAVPPEPTRNRTSLGFDLTAGAREDRWEASASTGYSRWISGEENLNTTDLNVIGQAKRRFERSSANLAASFRRGSTHANEITTTGIAVARVQSDTWRLAPSVDHALTERVAVNAGASFASTRYDQTSAAGGLVNNSSWTASFGSSYALAPVPSVGAPLSYGETDTEPFTSNSRTTSVQAYVNHTLSERWSVYAAYGPSWTHTEVAGAVPICPVPQQSCDSGQVPVTIFPTTVARDVRGSLYNLSSSYQLTERSLVRAVASRSSSPSGAGFVTDTEALSATFAHRFNERLAANLSASHLQAESLGGVVANSSTRTRYFIASLTWRAAQERTAGAAARPLAVSLPGSLEPSSSTLYLSLRYAPARWVLR